MSLIARNHSHANSVQNQKTDWRQQFAGCRWTDRGEVLSRRIQRSPLQRKPDDQQMPAALCIEDIEVYADRKHMYCKGNVRSFKAGARSNLVIAVEWLDEHRRALNTDWKRIEMQPDDGNATMIPNPRRPFIVKAPLDRRVKSVNAYAFSGNN